MWHLEWPLKRGFTVLGKENSGFYDQGMVVLVRNWQFKQVLC